jgi:hypothetical protein
MTDTPKLLLAHHLKTLKLPTVLREFDKVAQSALPRGWTMFSSLPDWWNWN